MWGTHTKSDAKSKAPYIYILSLTDKREILAKNRFVPAHESSAAQRWINCRAKNNSLFVIRFQYDLRKYVRASRVYRRGRSSLPLAGDIEISDRYFQFKDSLAERPRRYITYGEYARNLNRRFRECAKVKDIGPLQIDKRFSQIRIVIDRDMPISWRTIGVHMYNISKF